jgi:TetR/AcrR family transcriptional regulator of autoinduction and epiphytic fitness
VTDTVEDGRVARGRRTREAVIDALSALYAEDNLTPTIEDIASRVGMTTRSVYHHFQDRDAIAVALAEHQKSQHPDLFIAHPFSGILTERIDGLVAHRADLFETVAPVRRAALANMHASTEIRTQQTNLAARLRRQLTRTFEPELSALDRSTKAETIELLDLHTSWDTWERLRRWQSLSVPRSRRLLTELVTQTLDITRSAGQPRGTNSEPFQS